MNVRTSTSTLLAYTVHSSTSITVCGNSLAVGVNLPGQFLTYSVASAEITKRSVRLSSLSKVVGAVAFQGVHEEAASSFLIN
jgi:hypothetical protein